jgi:hypothetical protein
MCMKATPEGCELRDELKETKAAVASLDTRLTKVEGDVALMRSETPSGSETPTPRRTRSTRWPTRSPRIGCNVV